MAKQIAGLFLILLITACGIPTDNQIDNDPGENDPVTSDTKKVVKKPADDTTTPTEKDFTGLSFGVSATGTYASSMTGYTFYIQQFDVQKASGFIASGKTLDVALDPGHYYIRIRQINTDDGCNGMREFDVVDKQKTIFTQALVCDGICTVSFNRTAVLAPGGTTTATMVAGTNLHMMTIRITQDSGLTLHIWRVALTYAFSGGSISLDDCTLRSADDVVGNADVIRNDSPLTWGTLEGSLSVPNGQSDIDIVCSVPSAAAGEFITLTPHVIVFAELQFIGQVLDFDDIDQPAITKTITF